MSQSERVTIIRKDKKLTMEKFGKHLGVTKTAISRIESGINNLTNANIMAICREFNVNEKWLRTGEGDIYYTPDDRYAMNVEKLKQTDDETIIRWVNAIAETNPDTLREIEGFMKKLLDLNE